MTQRPVIGVGVPVWRGANFVGETLQSVLNQRDVNLQILVSIDGADEESARACRPFMSDARVRIFVQPHRIGWAGNSTLVLARLSEGADFVCVQPHDDWIEPNYLAALLDAAQSHPDAAVVFSDMIGFGTREGYVSQDSVTGTQMERQFLLITRHYNAIAYRGLMRVSAFSRIPPIPNNRHDNFACDTVWMARLARNGELIRVPNALYHKRYHANSTHAEWARWSPNQKLAAWTSHCVDMLSEAFTVARSRAERSQLTAAARGRLFLSTVELGPFVAEIRSMSPVRQWQLRSVFEASAAARSVASTFDCAPSWP